jgi:hypothetical protein
MRSLPFAVSVPLFIAGCASGPMAAMAIPDSIKAPSGEEMFLDARASGVQIYECAAKPGDASSFAWTFRAPEAALTDASGRSIGKHYAGPTWESTDGSRVVGEVKARDPGPDASAIPWLLLAAKSTSGPGVLEGTKSVQRLRTVGGNAPATPCGAANAKEVARVPYTATYYFYRARDKY